METCFRCGIPSERTVLYDAIAEEGIVKICERCRLKENLPIIKKSSSGLAPERSLSVRERMAYISGVSPEKEKKEEIDERIRKQNEELKKIIAKKYEEDIKNSGLKMDISGESGMVRNFHWVIMRARRARHMTQRELADEIREPETAIRMAEQGVLPREHEAIVKKIQDALKIQITKIPYDTYTKLPEEKNTLQETEQEALASEEDFYLDPEKEKRWTIGDLLRIKKRVKTKEKRMSISEALDEIEGPKEEETNEKRSTH